jgi:hypothetical protein
VFLGNIKTIVADRTGGTHYRRKENKRTKIEEDREGGANRRDSRIGTTKM